MNFKKIFYLESVVERGFYAIGMGLVILGCSLWFTFCLDGR